MYLFFDTETNGLPLDWNAPIHQLDNWPRMIQLAWKQVDINGNMLQEADYIIKPEGFDIPEDAVKIHGITTEQALREGLDLKTVLIEFASVIDRSDVLVAHNINFDEKIVGTEFLRMNVSHQMFQKQKICTMKQSTDFCRIPGNYGYKWPTLSELYFTLFKNQFTEAHNAAVDVSACVQCFFELRNRGILTE
ncbi:3'-5' exonuclease [bacterium]|nr:3'-5' exonuclease [bacterium]